MKRIDEYRWAPLWRLRERVKRIRETIEGARVRFEARLRRRERNLKRLEEDLARWEELFLRHATDQEIRRENHRRIKKALERIE